MSAGRVQPDVIIDAAVGGYRPWLDGVRAVAVLMVLAQHTIGQMPIDLGFVGVGLFFALSGYLITSLLLDEYAARGSVSLARFYARRAARLVPALVVVVLTCDVLFFLQRDYDAVKGSLFALTYTANYAEMMPGHLLRGYGPTWSLAVEEHFYLLWPLLLLGVMRRRNLTTLLRVTVTICVAALFWRSVLALMHAPLSLVGMGSAERADAILSGCAAAIAVRLGWRPQGWVVWAGIGLVAILPIAFARENYAALVIGNSVLALAGTALVVGLDYTSSGWLQRLLSAPVLVRLGVLSYGIYLWHGPLMRIAGTAGYAGPGWRAVAVLVSVGLASVSYRFVEAPIRAWARRSTPQRPTMTVLDSRPVVAG
jgi:peptidoglycan/LPS O-acetylase OafA/YrhL